MHISKRSTNKDPHLDLVLNTKWKGKRQIYNKLNNFLKILHFFPNMHDVKKNVICSALEDLFLEN